jgi:Immunoglobulin I-set domain
VIEETAEVAPETEVVEPVEEEPVAEEPVEEEDRDEGEYESGEDSGEESEADEDEPEQAADEEQPIEPEPEPEPEREPSEESEAYEDLIDPSLWEEWPNVKELEEQLEVLNRKRLERIKEFIPDRSEKEKFMEWDKERLSYRAVDIDVHLGARTGPIGSTIRLTCSASGPPFTVTWLKDRQPLTKSYQILSEDGFQTLVIANAQPEDNGWYTCVFNNKGGKRVTSARVRVYGTVDETPSSPLISLMNGEYLLRK